MNDNYELVNMSDGVKDGFVLFYVKDGEVYPIALSNEQLKMLDLTIPAALGNNVTIVNQSMGTVRNLKDENNG